MLGSLNDFMDIQQPVLVEGTLKEEENDDQIPASPLSKFSRKKVSQIKKRRTMSGVESYKASDKTLLFEKFAKNFPQIEKVKKTSLHEKEINHLTARRPISQSKLSSLFYGQNPSKVTEQITKDQYGGIYYKMQDDITKNQLKRQHNLLRAIVRTKLNQEQKITNTHYEDSFNRMSVGLKNIKIKQIVEDEETIEKQEPKTNRSLQIKVEKRSKSRISNRARIQFESCLNWSKKRNKNGSFYADKLGKNLTVQNSHMKSVEKRKSMLQFINQRAYLSQTEHY